MRRKTFLLVVLAGAAAVALLGEDAMTASRPSPVLSGQRAARLRTAGDNGQAVPAAGNASYSVELPLVVRDSSSGIDSVQPLDAAHPFSVSLVARDQSESDSTRLGALDSSPGNRTAIDIVNNTNSSGVTVNYQYSYTCTSASCSPPGAFFRTTVRQLILPALGSFHQDDFVEYLGSLGLLQPGAVQGSMGTLLMTFSGLPSSRGWEMNVIGTTYSRIVGGAPLHGTLGFGYPASLFFDSADSTLTGFARDSTALPGEAGRLQSDVGIRNTDILGTNSNMTVDLSFYDTATGARVGDVLTVPDLRPGEIRQITDLWSSARIPAGVGSVIVFADARNPGGRSATMEGYILWRDTQKSNSPRFFAMLCADSNGCGN